MNNPYRIELPWGTMAVHERQGEDPPLLFLHGTGCDAGDFDRVLDHLPRARAFRLEFRGHGDSTPSRIDFSIDDLAADVLFAIDRLSLHSVTLVGHSLGGMVALGVAPRTKKVSSLVLLEGWTRLGVVGRAFERSHMYGALSPEAVEDIQRRSSIVKSRYTKQRWNTFWKSVSAFDGTQSLAELSVPIHQVYGSAGALDDARVALAVPDRPNITWTWVPDAGHYLPFDAPDAVARICASAVDPTHSH